MKKNIRKAVRTYLIENDKILVIKYKGKNDGFYDIPGGKIEDYENSEQASIREYKEETGIIIEKQHYIGHNIIEYPDRIYYFDIYIVEEYSGNPIETDENYSMWKDLNEIKKEIKRFPSIEIISYLKDGMEVKVYCDEKHNILDIKN